ncbi:hypothetical protein ES703_103828 [subsurface metagenome]
MSPRPPEPPYVSDEQLTEAILSNLWDGDRYKCPMCNYSTPSRDEIVPHLQGHINDIMAGRIPFSHPIPELPKRQE